MKTFFGFFAKRNLLAYLITLLFIILGISTLLTIKRDAFPEVQFGEVIITTSYPGASPEDVELKVTNEIEKELKEVTGIKRYSSLSMENVSFIHIVIEPNEKDQDKVVREIREATSRVTDLPSEVTESPLVSELTTSVFPMVELGITGNLPYRELREIAKRFEKKLENVPGVSKVERFGYLAREIKIEVSPKEMNKHEVTLGRIIEAIKNRNVRATGGSFESYTSEKNIVTLAQFREPFEVKDVIVRTTFSGPLIKIKDLAIVTDGFEEEKVMSRVNGQSAISFVAYKSEPADIIRTVGLINNLVKDEQQYLPKGVTLITSDDRSTHVRKSFSIVMTNGAIGLALVFVVLAIFLNFRLAFWVALGIPVTVLGVIFLLPVFDSYLDTITLTAMVIVLGIVVDDAIIISENIYQKYEQGLSPEDAAIEGITGVFKPVVTTVLTTVVVFTPLFFMPGMLGKFVYVIPLVITLALFISLIESSLALPAHLVHGLKKRKRTQDSGVSTSSVFDSLRTKYKKIVYAFLHFRYLLILLFFLVLGGALFYAYKYMDFVLFPSSTADRFIILIETPPGTSLKATSDKASEIEKLVSQLDKEELDSFLLRVGTFGDIGSSERENNAALLVALTPFSGRERVADEIVEELRAKTDQLKGFQRIRYQIDAGGPPVGKPIMVRVVGSDEKLRNKLAADLVTFIESIEGTKDLDRNDKAGKQQVEIKLKYDKLARLGISVADVAQSVRIAYDGEVVTNVRYGNEDVDFRVIFQEQVRKTPEDLKELTLPNKNGRLTPLHQVATFKSGIGPSNLNHYKGERSITVTGDVDKEVTTPLKVSAAIKEHFDLHRDYPGMQLLVGGEAEESEQSMNDLFAILGIAALGIYFLLILLFNSLWQPLLVMIAIPFGVIGVIVGFSLHNEALGFLAMTGVIGLAGVVVNDSLVLVNHINELKQTNPEKNIKELVAQGTSNRLRAIVLTTVSTVVGLLPLAYGIGGSDPYMSPMALALGWGLLFATPLTLILLPCLYVIGNDVGRMLKRA